MEQSPSSLNLLFWKQSLWAFSVIIQGLIFYPCCVIEYSEDKLEVISVFGSPFLPQELCGVLLLQRRSCSGCLGIPERAWHRDCQNFQPRQQMCPAALGWRVEGKASPCPHSLTLSTCAPTEKQNPKLGFQSCPKNHISPPAIWKKKKKTNIFRFIHLFLSSMEFSQHKKLTCTSINKRREQKWCRERAWEHIRVHVQSSCWKIISIQKNCLVVWLEM